MPQQPKQIIAFDTSGPFYNQASESLIKLSELAEQTRSPGVVFFDAYDEREEKSTLHLADLIEDRYAIATDQLLSDLDGGSLDALDMLQESFEECDRQGWLAPEARRSIDWVVISDFLTPLESSQFGLRETIGPRARAAMLSAFQDARAVYAVCEPAFLASAQRWAREASIWRGSPVIALTQEDYRAAMRAEFEARELSDPCAPSPSHAGSKPRI